MKTLTPLLLTLCLALLAVPAAAADTTTTFDLIGTVTEIVVTTGEGALIDDYHAAVYVGVVGGERVLECDNRFGPQHLWDCRNELEVGGTYRIEGFVLEDGTRFPRQVRRLDD